MSNKVSKRQLLNSGYNLDENSFFATRIDRNNYYSNSDIYLDTGTYCAVANDPNVNKDDTENALWYLEVYNGANWTLVSLDDSFALVVTNAGLKALTKIKEDPIQYSLIITRVALRSEPIPAGTSMINYTDTEFKYNSKIQGNNPNLVVLDTADSSINRTFSMNGNLSYRINSANGGIQYIIKLDTDTKGLDYNNLVNSKPTERLKYNIGAVGLYVQDPEDDKKEILFAVGSISNPIYKYTTTATQTGNSVKLYLNTTLSNLGYVSDLTVMPEDTGSLPEVVKETDLPEHWDPTTTPHNVYLVDNLFDTGVPALAVRRGDPSTTTPIEWTYFNPSNNVIEIDSGLISQDVKDYMPVIYDGYQYVPATGNSGTLGIKIGNSVIYDGEIVNNTSLYTYNITVAPQHEGSGYKVGDTFKLTQDNVEFTIIVTEVTSSNGYVRNITYTPQNGNINVSGTELTPLVIHSSGQGLKLNVNSQSRSEIYSWTEDFTQAWLNKPVYVSNTTPGRLTNEITETFIGWCTGVGEACRLKLSLDLRSNATETLYGTTRYATNEEVKNGNPTSGSNSSAVTPEKLHNNYLNITMPTVSGANGTTVSNPITIYPYVKFDKTVVGKGYDSPAIESINNQDVSFYGRSYRALWGDLAEYYRSDKVYSAGTLITIGAGPEEITIARQICNGIISDKPGYILGDQLSELDLPVALIGKVPVLFAKDCDPCFGDRIYLSKTEPGRASVIPNGKCLGKIIDKGKDLNRQPTILCSIRLSF